MFRSPRPAGLPHLHSLLDNIQASYDSGVLTLKIPVAEHAKPRKIEISSARGGQRAISA